MWQLETQLFVPVTFYPGYILPSFFTQLYLTGAHFRGELQRAGDVSQQRIKCQPIRDR